MHHFVFLLHIALLFPLGAIIAPFYFRVCRCVCIHMSSPVSASLLLRSQNHRRSITLLFPFILKLLRPLL